ncbi:MAG: polysaccharide biosynthesis protein [Proteobacteria bacterium]|nr:polysaccharide biosynthesis protein [Pseudomonadota bacterium]
MIRQNIIRVEDVLPRTCRKVESDSIQDMIKDKVVLITGAGGSIGSEVTRQIIKFDPKLVLLVDNGEYNLYKIDKDLLDENVPRVPIIADVRDDYYLNKIFKKYKPNIVIHAAALKHVPMVEFNIEQGIHTNVIGTYNVANMCKKHNVEVMTMVSTDKVVNPTNVMGATKRIAEKYCQSLDLESRTTRFTTVRFGNVLGSRGSVFELFNNQLQEGRDLTLTDSKMERFFMTVPEASLLILNSASMNLFNKMRRGNIFVLRMGEPVKILDMIKKMVHLSGLELYTDVNIVETGLRPGEKLYEEMFYSKEDVFETEHSDIMTAQTNIDSLKDIKRHILCLKGLLQDHSSTKKDFLDVIKVAVPNFNHNDTLKERY